MNGRAFDGCPGIGTATKKTETVRRGSLDGSPLDTCRGDIPLLSPPSASLWQHTPSDTDTDTDTL